mgnify:CR=1 FL=1|tara:strand:- start:5012 stop:6016 length:1005 start_codon:yes stop_codon:yes gene_type:complete
MKKDECFAQLNLKTDASSDEVKKAYRKLAMIHHPDKGGQEKTFKLISEAYERIQKNDFAPSHQFNRHHPFDEMFSQNVTNSNSRVTKPGIRKPTKNQTILKSFDLTLEEAYNGESKKLSLKHAIPCARCSTPCDKCNSSGFITIEEHKSMGFANFVSTSTTTCPKCRGNRRVYQSGECTVCSNKRTVDVEKIQTIKFPQAVSQGRYKIFKNVIEGFDLDVFVNYKLPEDVSITAKGDILVSRKMKFTESIFGYESTFKHPSGEIIQINTRTLNIVMNDSKQAIVEGKGFKRGRQLIFQFKIEEPKLKPLETIDAAQLNECETLLKSMLIDQADN